MKDWRLDNVRGMEGIRFRRKRYAKWSKSRDHDHCAACFVKLAEFDGPGVEHQGYATCEDYRHGAGLRLGMDLVFSRSAGDHGMDRGRLRTRIRDVEPKRHRGSGQENRYRKFANRYRNFAKRIPVMSLRHGRDEFISFFVPFVPSW